VFAARRIRKGTTVIEYLGDRVSHAQADARYEDKDPNDNHTFLFTVDAKTVIDAGVDGNEARYINHGCDPNCESTTLEQAHFHRSDSHHSAGRRTVLRLSDPARCRRRAQCR
jgi:SET domain-containing protein